MKTHARIKAAQSAIALFIVVVLLHIMALPARAIPRATLTQEDGSAMFVADTIHLFNPGSDPVLVQGSSTDDNKIPLLLIHGIDQGNVPGKSLQDSWYNFVTFFQANPALSNTYKLYIVAYNSNVVSVDKLGEDFGSLLSQLDQVTHGLGGKPFVILAHSMGGLVSRALMNKQQTVGGNSGAYWGERVIKLITLATPHHGTPLANSTSPFGALGSALGPFSPFLAVADHFYGNIPFSAVNRSDLRWDNYNPNMLNHGSWDSSSSDRNIWLQGLNASELYRPRIIGYAGYIDSSFSGHDTTLLGTEAVIATAVNLPNDGAVPLASAVFDQNVLSATYIKTDYDHYHMCKGKGATYGEILVEPLFTGIRGDLTTIASKLPAPFSITASSQSANGASYVQVTTTAQPLAGEIYTLDRNSQSYAVFSGSGFQNTQVTPGTTYSYYVQAVNAVGTTVSNTVSVTVLNPVGTTPTAPSNLTATAASPTQINLSWSDNSNVETGYVVERKTGASGTYAPIIGSPFPANTTARFDTGLSPSTIYFYRVTATASTNSPPSGEASTYTQSVSATTRVLTVNSSNPASGVHVYVSPNDTNGLADGDSSFSRQYTSSVTATVVAPATWSGNTFQKWQKDGQDWTTSTVANVVMDASHTMVAVYTVPTQTGTNYTIAVSATPSNGGTVSGNGSYPANSQATIQATAAQGYTFLNWTRNTSGQNGGTTLAVQPQVQFQATSNLSLVANFTQNANNNYTVTTTAEPANGGTASGAGSYSPSSNVSLSAQPAAGYVFDYWTENGVVISYIQSYQYPQISQAHNFVALFHVRGSGTPDLVPSMALDRQFYFPGDTVNITGDVKNKGTVASNPCQLYWVVSDSAASPPDPATVWSVFPGILFWMPYYPSIPAGVAGGAGVGLQLTDYNGTALAPGNYYMWMLFDPTNTDGETAANRVNNNLVVPFTVLPLPPNNGPDLIPHDFSATPTVTFPSGTLNVKGGIRNVGNVASTGFKYYVSVSTSATVAPDKNALNVSGTVPGLGVYVDAGADSSFLLPSTLAPGNYYLWIMVDPENSAGEPAGNRANNSIVLPLTIAQPLQTFTINASASSVTAGSVSGGGVYPNGGLVPVVATPASGYQFVNWTENGTSVSPAQIYSFTATGDRTLVANFAVVTPFSSWQTSHFSPSQLSQPSLSGWNGDANGSGIPNGLKFFFNLNPTGGMTASDSSALPHADVEMSGGNQYLTLTYRQNPQASAVGVQLLVSPDLAPSSWLPVTPDFTVALTPDPITGDPRTKVMVNIHGDGKKFIRLQITAP